MDALEIQEEKFMKFWDVTNLEPNQIKSVSSAIYQSPPSAQM